MGEDRLTDRLNQERITTRLQKQEIQKLETQNQKLQKKLGELKQQLLKREQEIQEEEIEILQREEEVKEQYDAIKDCLNGNIQEKMKENAELKQELQTVITQKEQLEVENKLLRDTSENLQGKVNDLTSTLTEKTNTIANLNMIVKLQATRIEGFMADNAHHLEQNLKLNRLLEANSKHIAPEQKSSHQIQRSINAILTKPLLPTAASLPENTYTLFDHAHPADTKAAKRPLDESTHTAAISKSNQRSTTYSSPESSRGSTIAKLKSPELGDSPFSCIDLDSQNEGAVVFDVSLSPRDTLSLPEQNERPLVYLDESSFENTLSSPTRLKSMSPPDKNARESDTRAPSLTRRHSQSSDIQRRISLLDEAQKRSLNSCEIKKKNLAEEIQKRTLYSKGFARRPSYSNELPRRLSVCDENDVPDVALKNETPADSRQPLTNATNVSTTQKPIALKTGQLNQLLPQVKNASTTKSNMRPLTVKHQHGKNATCIACEKFYDTGPLPDAENTDHAVSPRQRIQLHSRHRARETTPPEFWDLGFPYTLSP